MDYRTVRQWCSNARAEAVGVEHGDLLPACDSAWQARRTRDCAGRCMSCGGTLAGGKRNDHVASQSGGERTTSGGRDRLVWPGVQSHERRPPARKDKAGAQRRRRGRTTTVRTIPDRACRHNGRRLFRARRSQNKEAGAAAYSAASLTGRCSGACSDGSSSWSTSARPQRAKALLTRSR